MARRTLTKSQFNTICIILSLLTMTTTTITTILANGLTKHAFRVGQVGEKFGEDCANETEQWERQGDGAIWGCSHQWGCAVRKEYRSRFSVDKNKVMHVIPNVTRNHFGTYTCQTNPFNIGTNENKKFEYQVTVYEGLQCKDNVTVHRAGETIELQCGILHWGDGDPDLRFHLFDQDGAILRDEVTLDKRDKSLFLTIKLERYHHGKRFGCSFLGFDGIEALRKLPDCFINEQTMDVLYAPTITKGPSGIKVIGEGDWLELECLAEGNPSPKSSFLLNGDQATLDRRVKAVRTLRNITCHAQNQIGSETTTQTINVLSFVPIYPNNRKTEGENIKLGCELEQSNPNSETIIVRSSINGHEIGGAETYVTVDGSFDGKRLKCTALDRRGKVVYENEADHALDVAYGPLLNCTQQIVNKITGDFEITCYVAKNPAPAPEDVTLTRHDEETIVNGTGGIAWKAVETRPNQMAVVVTIAKDDMKKMNKLTLMFGAGPSVRNGANQVKEQISFNYVEPEPELNVGLVAGASVGAGLLLLLVILWVTLIVKGAICKKDRVVEKTPTIINHRPGPTPSRASRGRDDAFHGTPPVMTQSMNGYVNKAATQKDDGLVFAELSFNESQPRSRAPILDFSRYEFELNPDRLAAV